MQKLTVRLNESRRHAIHPRKIHPLHRQHLGQLHHGRLGGIVRRLPLGDVDERRAHRRRDDEVAPPLLLEDPARRLRRPHDAVVVDAVVVRPRLLGVLEAGYVGAHARVGHHNVQAPAKVGGDGPEGVGHGGPGADVAVVGSYLDARGRGNDRGGLLGGGGAGAVDDGDRGAGFGEAADDFEADAPGTTRNGGDFALEGELGEHGVVGVVGAVERHDCGESSM